MSQMRIGMAILISLLAVSFGAMAQMGTTGNIRGVVTDETGALVPGATVTIRSDALMGERTAVTNNSGVYRFPAIPPGSYTVDVALAGFQTYREEDIEVRLGATATVDVTLKLGKVEETVTVSGESPVVDLTKSGFATNWKDEMVEDLPTNRQMYDWFMLSPGIAGSAPDGQGYDVHAYGGGYQNNAFHIDGINVTSPDQGASWWGVNPDIIEEVEVMGIGAPAEYGSALGAHLVVITKSGGNQFSGGANYFWQTDALTASNVTRPAVSISTGQTEEFGFHRDEYRDVTANLGGPISHDRVWFFAAAQIKRSSVTVPGTDPAIAEFGRIGDPYNQNDRFDFKLTSRLSDRHQLDTTVHYERWAGFEWDNPTFTPDAIPTMWGKTPAWKAGLTSTFSENTLMELKYAGWWGDGFWRSITGSNEEPFVDYAPVEGGPFQISDGYPWVWDYFQWSHHFEAKATNYAEDFLNSQHEFRFGAQYGYGSARTDARLGVTGSYLTKFSPYGYLYRAVQEPYDYASNSNNVALFLDDSITVGDRLTLNLGVRYDRSRGDLLDSQRLTVDFEPTGRVSEGADDILRWDNVSPRVGFALRTTKEGRGVIKGAFALLYDQNVMGNWRGQIADRPRIEYSWFDPVTDDFFDPFGVGTLCCTFGSDDKLNFDIDPPRLLEYSVGFDQQLSTDVSVGVQYVFRKAEDFIGIETLSGDFELVPFTDPFTGNQFTLFKRLEDPVTNRGNGPAVPESVIPFFDELPRFESDYHGVFLTFAKRFSHGWSLSGSYTWSRAEGMFPNMLSQGVNGAIFAGLNGNGNDINHFVNGRARLQSDIPHRFRLQAFFGLPADFMVSTSINVQSGRPFARQMRVFGLGVPAGVVVTMEPRGSKTSADVRLGGEPLDTLRHPTNKIVDIRIGKRIPLGGNVRLIVDGTLLNALNDDASWWLATQQLNPGDDFVPSSWVLPRRLMLRVGFDF